MRLLQALLIITCLVVSSCARPLTLERAQEKVRRGMTQKEINKRYYRAYPKR